MSNIPTRLITLRGKQSRRSFADKLGIKESTLRNYEQGSTTASVDLLELICKTLRIEPRWLLLGEGAMSIHPTTHLNNTVLEQQSTQVSLQNDVELVMIPKVAARLAAGGGSLETSGEVLGQYSFRADWIYKKGNVSQMVLMEVTGDSMLPEIKHGDMVLIDQSKIDIYAYRYYAIGIEDAIYIKQLRTKPGQLILHSLNLDYEDIVVDLTEEQPDSVRIIGRVLWIARDLA